MIIKSHELRGIRKEHRNERISLRFGCYDLIHADHQKGIDYAKAQADILVIGVMPDSYIRKTKGPHRPIHYEEHRVAAIDTVKGVDYSVIAPAGRLALAGFVAKLHPDVYVEAEEYGESGIKATFLDILGTDYVIDRRLRVHSTTQMIAQLAMNEASKHLDLSDTCD